MLLFTFSLYGCNVEMSQKVNETLYQAENCMEEFPDSALSLLQHISHPEDLKGKAQADYALLYSQACDKNRISITNDSLIRIAVRYYKDKDEDLNAAKSYFYLGCVYRNANQDAMAIEAYLKHWIRCRKENRINCGCRYISTWESDIVIRISMAAVWRCFRNVWGLLRS